MLTSRQADPLQHLFLIRNRAVGLVVLRIEYSLQGIRATLTLFRLWLITGLVFLGQDDGPAAVESSI